MAADATSSTSSDRKDTPTENNLFEKVLLYDPQELPERVKIELENLVKELEQGDITQQGYCKKKFALLERYSQLHEQHISQNEDAEKPLVELIEPDHKDLPSFVVLQLEELQKDYENEELTLKGYSKRRLKILEHYMLKEPPVESLPPATKAKLRELEVELEDGDITEKGFQKKRKLLIKQHLVPVNPLLYHKRKRKIAPERKKNNNDSPIDNKTVNWNGQSSKYRTIYSETVDVAGVKLFRCNICWETFKQPQSFSAHCRTHRGSSQSLIKCMHCDATFTTKSHLKVHMFKHTGLYPFVCSLCGKGFGQRGNLRVHEERHARKQCQFCGTVFSVRSRFLEHQSECAQQNAEAKLSISNPTESLPKVELSYVENQINGELICNVESNMHEQIIPKVEVIKNEEAIRYENETKIALTNIHVDTEIPIEPFRNTDTASGQSNLNVETEISIASFKSTDVNPSPNNIDTGPEISIESLKNTDTAAMPTNTNVDREISLEPTENTDDSTSSTDINIGTVILIEQLKDADTTADT